MMRRPLAARVRHPAPAFGQGAALALLLPLSMLLLAGPLARDALAQVPSFTGVGDLPGGAATSEAFGVSADGAVVVGRSESADGSEAFRWTVGGGLSGLGFLSGSVPFSEAVGVSADGSVVVGNSYDGNGDRAFRWTAGGGLVELGTFSCSSCDPATGATGVSGNGLVVVGVGLAKSLFGDPHLDAARWSGGGTSISNLGDLPGPAELNSANGASADGAVIVGEGDSNNGFEAWVWTSSTGMDALPAVPGAQVRTGAVAVSADASTIVGAANTDTASSGRLEAARWTGPGWGTLQLLGSLGTASSQANGVSGDGSIIVGRARNAANDQRAFLWDAVNGMRDLASVLADDYGIDLDGWVLREAHGVSDVGPDGEFVVVGAGTNPAGEPEGFVALLFPPACRDGLDNDNDLDSDWPADAQCWGPVDLSEVDDCNDGLDNDGDGQIDHPADDGCRDTADATERLDCSDGVDDDGDGLTDHPDDPGCASPDAASESPACDDGEDNDSDSLTDHPDDPGCTARSDLSEGPDCADGLDNDGDGDFDWPADSDCTDAADASEAPECRDGVDNDGDGRIDALEEYPDCVSPDDPIEAPQCGDGVDNDGDGDVDLADADCASPGGLREAPGSLVAGDLLVVDRTSRAVFAVDPVSGQQIPISQAGRLGDPQSIAQRADGEPVVADPAGLVAVDPVSGVQEMRSAALDPGQSLALVFDGAGDALVVESAGIARVQWNASGLGSKSLWLPVPTGEPIPQLGVLQGDNLAVENGGASFLTSGLSVFGDGVFRIDATPSASLLKPGFSNDQWLDLAVVPDGPDAGDIVAVGVDVASGPGVYRIDPVNGAATAISVGPEWVLPVAVAVAPGGPIWVGDAGTCANGSCSGTNLASVDPGSGLRTVVATGGLLQGEMDLAVAVDFVPEPGALAGLVAGMLALWGLARARRRS